MRITGGQSILFRRIRQNCPGTYPSFPLGNGLWPIRVLVAWLDGLVEILVSVEFTGSPQSFGAYIISQATGFLRYAAKL
jgi:hypothetical protein